jgi:RHH-type transcriptional regulator, proline utilization regulon repressor / proline dehydrogenase / delta 1-pyrroline-5-carboxylate dehydrogenase
MREARAVKTSPNLEEEIRKIGREIYSLMGEEVPALFDKRRWTGKIMEWVMKDEELKVPLFRFVDVLPSLKSDDLVIRLLNEYFSDVETAPLMKGLGFVSGKGFLPHLAGKLIRSNVESMARQFIAGRSPEDGLPSLENLRKEGLAVSVDLLGEEVLSDRDAILYADRYGKLLDFLGAKANNWPEVPILDRDDRGPIPKLDVSLKISSFNPHLDPIDWEGCIRSTAAGVAPILAQAEKLGASVTFDMEHHYLKDLTIAVFLKALDEHPGFAHGGIALQAYLREMKTDLANIVEWAKKKRRRVGVRLTKGAYWDFETVTSVQEGLPTPVFAEKAETDAHYEELTGILLENAEHLRLAFATHNIRSISHAIALAGYLKLPREAFEFQMIYGMAEPVRSALGKMGFRVRVYTPVGKLIPGMAYLIRRLLENTSNESFLKKSFAEGKSPEELTRPPQPPARIPQQTAPDDRFRNEPLLDFSLSANREGMRHALVKVKKELGRSYPLLLGRSEVKTESLIRSVNPADPAEIVGNVSAASAEHVEKAVEQAKQAWTAWRNVPPADRARYLFRAAQEMRSNRFELMALEVYEVGKAWKEADADVAEAIDFLEYYGREAIRIGAPALLGNYPGEENICFYEPKGVGAVISPWNFPLAIPAGMVSAGIVTGNCVIFKPSSLSPVTGWRLVEMFRRVGLPSGVLQFLSGAGGEVGERLVAHPGVDFVTFTGSKDAGLRIVKMAGETHDGQRSVKRVIAEMGGKNAIIVDESADLDAAVKGVLQSALGFQGQKCSACSRVIVVGQAFEEFCRRLKESAESLRIGPPEDPAHLMGPVVDDEARRRILHYVELGKRDGRVILAREVRGEQGAGYYVGPVIIADPDPNSPVVTEEIFGPVIAVFRARDIEAALNLANGTPFALTGGLYSRSPANIRKVQTEFSVGNLYINRKITGALVGRQPFGGFGMSGVGSKTGGSDYLLQFTNMKCVSENTLRRGFAPKARSAP